MDRIVKRVAFAGPEGGGVSQRALNELGVFAQRALPASDHLLRGTFDDDDGVVGVDDDRVMRTAPLGVVSGAVVGVVTGLSSG